MTWLAMPESWREESLAFKPTHANGPQVPNENDVPLAPYDRLPRLSMSENPSIRELLAKAKPVALRPLGSVLSEWFLRCAACLAAVATIGALSAQLPLWANQAIWLSRWSAWGAVAFCVGGIATHVVGHAVTLARFQQFMANQIEKQSTMDQHLISHLAAQVPLERLQSLGRRLTFEAKMNEGFNALVGIVGALGAASIAIAIGFPEDPEIGKTAKVYVPAFLIGTGFAGWPRHSFARQLHRAAFLITEAERESGGSEE